jgi:hypothetical protein
MTGRLDIEPAQPGDHRTPADGRPTAFASSNTGQSTMNDDDPTAILDEIERQHDIHDLELMHILAAACYPPPTLPLLPPEPLAPARGLLHGLTRALGLWALVAAVILATLIIGGH